MIRTRSSIEQIMEKAKSFEKEDAENYNTECQGCGRYGQKFECAECDDTFCSKFITKDHRDNRHMCLICESDSEG